MDKIKFPVKKAIYALFISALASILVSFASVFAFSVVWFIVIFVVCFFSVYKEDNSDALYNYFIRSIKYLFFFLPISAIFYSSSITNSIVSSADTTLEAWAWAVWGAIWGFVVIVICLIIGLVWGLIIWAFSKKVEIKEDKTRSLGLLFVTILILSVVYLNKTSEVEKVIEWTNNVEVEQQVWEKNEDSDESSEEGDSNNEESLNDKIGFSLDWFEYVKWDFMDSFKYVVTLENKSDKEIAAYKWGFEVYDLFGDRLWNYSLDRISSLKAWDKYSDELSFSYNSFDSNDVKLSKLKLDWISVKYEIDEIIYVEDLDLENNQYSVNTGEGLDKVSYKVLSKENKEGDFQNYLVYNVEIKNNSDKQIKGIKWGFYAYDLFWEKIWSYELNITTPINALESINEELSYSINQFMSEDNKVYETPSDYLKYNFKIEKVVYAE